MTRAGREDRLGWALAAGLAAYVLFATLDWRLPDAGGVPFGPAWAALAGAGVLGARVVRRRWEPLAALAVAAIAAALLTDLTQFWGQPLRDLGIYLKAGERFSANAPVYLTSLVTERPPDLTNYPFLYPPPALPVFALLAALPRPLVEAGWAAGSIAAALGGLRLIGLPWRWAVAALVWPPFFQGLYVGNVSVPAFALFAAAPWFGAGLVLAAVFKPYSAVAALWLVRERRFRALGLGVGIVAAGGLVTLPLAGLDLWRAWIEGIRLYSASQSLVPASLIAMGLSAYLPEILVLGVSVAAVAWGWLGHGRDGLARFGVATVVAAPSAFAHGFLVALPAFLGLRTAWLWVVLGITSVAPGVAWWLAILVAVAASFLPGLRREDGGGPWPAAPGSASSPPAPPSARTRRLNRGSETALSGDPEPVAGGRRDPVASCVRPATPGDSADDLEIP